MENFQAFGLQPELLRALDKLGFATPTPIQAASIPVALEGRDIMGTAQTGTGKTGAFGIPLIARLLDNPQDTALVMTPTRELAAQVMDMLRKMLNHNKSIPTALLIGGEPMPKQFRQLQMRPRLVVGTPGRINDHLQRRSLSLANVRYLVLDETDRMLDMGFGIQIDQILTHVPQDRQTLLFSATLPDNILKLSSRYLRLPERISTGATNKPTANIKQETIQLGEPEKYNQLVTQLEQRDGSIIVFVKTKWGADKMAKRLRAEKHAADAIHGDLRQSQRDRVIRAFRNKDCRILVATDVAARGLDIPHIEHVINYDLPQCPEDYIHRIGRTARAGAEGEAVNLVTPQDGKKWTAIRRLMNPEEKREKSQRAGGHEGKSRSASGKPGSKSGFKGGFKGDFKGGFKSGKKQGGKPGFKSDQKSEYKADFKPDFKKSAKPAFKHADKPDAVAGQGQHSHKPRKPHGAKPAHRGGNAAQAPFKKGKKPFFANGPKKANNGQARRAA